MKPSKTTYLARKNLINTAIEHEVEAFILVSSDKAVNPTSVYGAFQTCDREIGAMQSEAEPHPIYRSPLRKRYWESGKCNSQFQTADR